MKKKALNESNSVVSGLLGFLSESGKTNLLSSVAQELDEVVGKAKRADEIVITSAVAFSRQEIKQLQTIMSRFLGKNLPAVNVIDKQVLGGFSLRVGDFFLDATVARELDVIKNVLKS